MSWWQIHAPISPTAKKKSPPVSGSFCTRVCVRRASPCAPLPGLIQGKGDVSAGHLPPPANPSTWASGGAVTKPGPDVAGNGWHLSAA